MHYLRYAALAAFTAAAAQPAGALQYYEPVPLEEPLPQTCIGKERYRFLPFQTKYDRAAGFIDCVTRTEVFSPCDQLENYYMHLRPVEGNESTDATKVQLEMGLKARCQWDFIELRQ